MFELIKTLSERHEVHLVVRAEEGQERELEPLRDCCAEVHPVFYRRPGRRGLFGIPGIVLSSFRLCRKANRLAKTGGFDVIHAEWTETGLFLRKRGAMVVTAHDVLTKPMFRRYRNHAGLRRLWYRVLHALTRMLELAIYRKFGTVFVLSEHDRDYLLSLDPLLRVGVLRYPAPAVSGRRDIGRGGNRVLFLGAMDRGPNVEAVLYFRNEVLPLVRRGVPDVQFTIAGSRPLPEVRQLARDDPGIIVTGFVEDIGPYYESAAVFAAPLLTGGGIIIKILDALSRGVPVVTTSIGNEGIRAEPGRELLIGDTAAEFAGHVVRLLRDPDLRERIGTAGRKFVVERYGADALRKSLKEWYPEKAEGKAHRA